MKIFRKKIIILVLFELIGSLAIFSAGLFLGRFSDFGSSLSFFLIADRQNSKLFAPYNQAWDEVHNRYLNQPVDDTKLMQGSIKGMMESLGDPYSSYLDPEQFREQNAPLEGEYTGIGAWVDTSGEFLVIISPMPDSPAEKAGLYPGDTVIEIDNEDVTDLDPTLVLNKILGPANTKIIIKVLREGETEPLLFEITRALIPIPSVEKELINEHIGYIRLYSFAINSYDDFSTAVSELLEQGADNFIIDLRNNTGGIVDSAIDITSIFLQKDEVIFVEEFGDGTRNEYKSSREPQTDGSPLFILVNQGTASASEIMAGALQDHNRATLIGSTTFGKGLIQNWIPLVGDNGAIQVTIAHWLTPHGRQIQDLGLTADIEIDYTQADFEAGIDPQLEKALEIINAN